METLLPVRSALLEGDIRPLYLGWLAGVASRNVRGEVAEPPVPPGLADWNSTYLADLREFLCVPTDMLYESTKRRADLPGHDEIRARVQPYVSHLDTDCKDNLLAELIPTEHR